MASLSTIQQAYEVAAKKFIENNPKSKRIHEQAIKSLPGGNTRTVLFYEPFPLSITSAKGSRLICADGREYVDFLGEYTAGLYGHSDPIILQALNDALQKGLNFGSHHADEAELARLVKDRFPAIDLLRFTNSGTEANLMAIALAKVYTGRSKILVFGGSYHGGVLHFKAGGSSPLNAPHDYIMARYNDLGSVEALMAQEENAKDLAAIIVEPMIGSGGAIPGDRDFLIGLSEIASKHNAVLIFDEVMTSRLYNGSGVQAELPAGSLPDLTTLGKWIGGGMSFGCFGGKREILELFDPRKSGALAHAGTFNNNVLTMAAGRAGMEKIFTPDRAKQLHKTGEELQDRLSKAGQGTLFKVTGCGSLFNLHFTKTPAQAIKRPDDIDRADEAWGDLLHLFLLEKGYYIARRGFVALSLSITQDERDGLVNAVEDFIHTYRSALTIE